MILVCGWRGTRRSRGRERICMRCEWCRWEPHKRLWAIGLLLLFALALRIPYMEQPIRFDEATTYEDYVSQSLLDIWTTYNAPNNHIFHSLLARLATIETHYSEWRMRLPAFFAGLGVVVLIFLYGERLFGTFIGWLAGLICAGSANMILFSTIARGYSIIVFLTLLSFYAADQLVEKGKFQWRFIYVLSNIFGCFTIPIMVYPLFASALFLFIINFRKNRTSSLGNWAISFACMHASIVLGVSILYAPTIFKSGIHALFGNSFVSKIPFDEFIHEFPPSVFKTLDTWVDAIHPIIPTLGFVVYLLDFLNKKESSRKLLLIIGCLLLSGFIITGFKQVVPFSRVWVFAYPFFVICISLGLGKITKFIVIWSSSFLFQYLTAIAIPIFIFFLTLWNLNTNDPILSSSESGSAREVPNALNWLENEGYDPINLILSFNGRMPAHFYSNKKNMNVSLWPNLKETTWVFVMEEYGETQLGVLNRYGLVLTSDDDLRVVKRFGNSALYLLARGEAVSLLKALDSEDYFRLKSYTSNWYGEFSLVDSPAHILHQYHGVQYFAKDSLSGQKDLLWCFDYNLNEWLMLIPSHYPYFYLGSEKKPILWQNGTQYPKRIFYDVTSGRMLSESEMVREIRLRK